MGWTELSLIGCPFGELSSLGNTSTHVREWVVSIVSGSLKALFFLKQSCCEYLHSSRFLHVWIVVLTFFYSSITEYWPTGLHTPLLTCYSNIFYEASDKIQIYIFGKCFSFQWCTNSRTVCLEICSESFYPLKCESVYLCRSLVLPSSLSGNFIVIMTEWSGPVGPFHFFIFSK